MCGKLTDESSAEAATTPTPAEEPAAEEGELNCHFHAGIE